MKGYNTKKELIDAIEKSYGKFVLEFQDIDEKIFKSKIDEVDKSPFEMIAYQIGWIDLLLEWEEKEKNNIIFSMPKDNFKWNQLGMLNNSFYELYKDYNKNDLILIFSRAKQDIINFTLLLSDSELFCLGKRKWAGEKWNLSKWIHINSVAPFTNFRTKIRKFKKYTRSKES